MNDRARAELAAGLLLEGLTLRAAGGRLGVTAERVRQLVAAHPDLEEAVRAARSRRAAGRASDRAARNVARAAATVAARRGRPPRSEAYPLADLERIAEAFLRERGEPAASSLDFRAWLDEHHPGGPIAQTFLDRLGPSWADVCERFGYRAVGGRGIGQDASACLAAVRRVQRKVGSPPTVAEYERLKRAGEPARKTVAARLGEGKWSNVVKLLADAA